MMYRLQFESCLAQLKLSQTEAARLLSVSARTVRRWVENPDEIRGPAEQALRAWMRLDRLGLSWRPDAIAIGEEDPDVLAEEMAIHRRHTIELDALIERVKARGGPIAPWTVDLQKRRATLGKMELGFYPLLNGTFSPGSYTRYDREPDKARDWQLLEDGFAVIAQEVATAGPNWALDGQSCNLTIIFQPPTYNARRQTLYVQALDGNQSIVCSVQRAALERLAGVRSLDESETLQVFERHRDRIIRAFQRKYLSAPVDAGEAVVLTPDDPI
jgi:hypothetical protein